MSGSAEPVGTGFVARPAAPVRGMAARVRAVCGRIAASLGAGLADPLGALARARADLALWVPVALGLGVGGYFSLPREPSVPVIAGGAVLLVAGVWAMLRAPVAARFPAALVALVALGFLVSVWRAQDVAAPVLGFRYYGPVEGRIVKVDRSARDRIRLTLDQVTLAGVAPERTPSIVRLSLQDAQDNLLPEPGLRVMTTAHLQPPGAPAEPGAWDFRRAAWFSGLGAVGYSRVPVMLVEPGDPDDLGLAGHRLRMEISRAMQERIPGQAGAVAAALMTGDRSGILETTNDVMRVSGLYHIISISGLHMGMLAGFVFAAVRYGIAACGSLALVLPAKKIAALVALVAATIYLWIAGPEVATQRSYLMAAVMLLAVLLDRQALSLRTVAMAGTVLILMRPESLTEPGFQMSFAATIGLITIYAKWAQMTAWMPKLLRPAVGLLLTSLIAGVATGPIAAAHFNRGGGYGLLANFLAVPVMGAFVMPAGVIAALLAPLGIEAPALWVMEMGTRWMIFVAEQVAALPGAVVMIVRPPAVVLPLMGLCAAVAVLSRGAVRLVAVAGVALGLAIWTQGVRPALIVAPEGEQVGLMTPAGRVLSKPGAAYVAENWLEADGDAATAEAAAARPGFEGPAGARVAQWAGRSVVHLTGKGAGGRVAEHCRDNALIILAAPAPEIPARGCEVWDQTRLKRSGALAFDAEGRRQEALAIAGQRLWTRQ